MAAIAIIDSNKDHTITINEMRPSFSDYSSACQYIAVCSCGWTESHVVLHALTGTAAQHANEQHNNDAPRAH